MSMCTHCLIRGTWFRVRCWPIRDRAGWEKSRVASEHARRVDLSSLGRSRIMWIRLSLVGGFASVVMSCWCGCFGRDSQHAEKEWMGWDALWYNDNGLGNFPLFPSYFCHGCVEIRLSTAGRACLGRDMNSSVVRDHEFRLRSRPCFNFPFWRWGYWNALYIQDRG